MEQPHSPHVALKHDLTVRRWSLWHVVTGEIIDLPALPGPRFWSLHFNEDGFGYLNDGKRTQWIASMLRTSMHVAPNGSVFLNGVGGSRWLRDIANMHTEHRLNMDLEKTTEEVLVYRFTHACRGAHLWWSLPHWHRLMRVSTNASPKGWVQKGWPAWQTLANSLWLGPPHLRRQVEDGRTVGKAPQDYYLGCETRVLPTACASTFVILALMCNWIADPNRHLSGLHSREIGKDVLDWLLSFLPENFQLRFVVSESALVGVGLPIGDPAAPSMMVPVRGGKVILSELVVDRSIADHCSVKILAYIMNEEAEVELSLFMLFLVTWGTRSKVIVAQCIWQLGQALALAFLANDAATLNAGPTRKRKHLDRDSDWRRDLQIVSSYWVETRTVMEGKSDLSMAVDCSVVGDRNTMVGVVSGPGGGVVAWSFPQEHNVCLGKIILGPLL